MVYITPYLTPKGDSIMVSVATGGSHPEKLPFLFLVPHLAVSELHSVCNIGLNYSMLGFGDIIIPGFLGGYCAYFDLLNVHAHYYYWWTFIFSYGFGLILTFVALILMATGQPALFFLVPSTVGSLLLCAYVRKETNFFWNGPKLKESLN
jgi:presenilin-like A22 family membrane protease